MEQNNLTEKQAKQDQLAKESEAASDSTMYDKRLNTAGATTKRAGRGRSLFGSIRASLQAVEGILRGTSRTLEDTARELPGDTDEMSEETSGVDDNVLNLLKWVRQLVIPLAMLAWACVAILVLWLAGHISRTILLLVIAALLAYGLAPLVTFLERVMPRFVAILIVYFVVLCGIGALLYMVVRTAIGQVTSLSGYLGGLLTAGSSSHPPLLERTLNSFGISSAQIASLRNQVITQTEGLVGNVVPLLTEIFNAALDVIVVAVLSIYLLVDGGRVTSWLRRNMPRRQRGRAHFLLETLQRIVGGYIRGQLLLCSLIGVLVGLGMAFFHVPYALLLSRLRIICPTPPANLIVNAPEQYVIPPAEPLQRPEHTAAWERGSAARFYP